MNKDKEVEFQKIVEASMNRRSFLKKSVVVGTSFFVSSAGFALEKSQNITLNNRLAFEPVEANTLDTITLPKGFRCQRVLSWGDPLWSNGVALHQNTRGDAASQSLAFGDNNDGMDIFTHKGKTILAVNNEYINLLHFHGQNLLKTEMNLDDVIKAQSAVGVSIVELKEKEGGWDVVKDSIYNRKITAQSDMDITGPAKGHALLQTSYDPKGVLAKGTYANCGNGKTPWGTYLTCEENFNFYFSVSKEEALTKEHKRYGIKNRLVGHRWATFDKRFDVTLEPNEPNRMGYVVEIDPLNPNALAKKLTALGRLKHENAEVVIAKNGHAVVYMGDDERGEYLYKFISKEKVDPKEPSLVFEDGTIYVAKFLENGLGEWIALTKESTGMEKAEICVFTRLAASKVGATTMDRPEWVAAHPHKCEVYCSLTNNKNRGIKPNAGGDATPVDAVNPRKVNKYGQVVKWVPKSGDHSSNYFEWNLFVLAGNPVTQKGLGAGSQNITPDNMFNSPDGLKFDTQGGLWIQTDGNYSNRGEFKGMGNNQMLLANTLTGEIKRFMVGPKECEITGLTWSEDKKTMFVGIQHPGEMGGSVFPDGQGHVPRSSIIAVTREDGGTIEL